MKIKNITLGILILAGTYSFSQFTDADGKDVTSCDCMDPVNYLDYTVTLPENYGTYDYIQFVAYRNGEAISTRLFEPGELPSGTVKLSVLSPSQKALRTMLGQEYGRYRGLDFTNISYNSMCEYLTKTELEITSLGIRQVGTETTYTLDANKTTVTARTAAIYDGGVELTRSSKVAFNKN